MTPEQCPAAETHGNPFRYCGTCSWVEEPSGGAVRLTDEERERIACDTPRPEAPVATEPGCAHPECTLTHPHAGPAVLRAREDG